MVVYLLMPLALGLKQALILIYLTFPVSVFVSVVFSKLVGCLLYQVELTKKERERRATVDAAGFMQRFQPCHAVPAFF
jgi:hypothetical protein